MLVYHVYMSKEKSFKNLEQELDGVLARVEAGEYEELDELLADHKKGSELIELLEKKLETAKNSITTVNKKAGK